VVVSRIMNPLVMYSYVIVKLNRRHCGGGGGWGWVSLGWGDARVTYVLVCEE
jgi:hypothetical protein